MGNCQAIDNATLLVQHPNGRVDKFYFPAAASEIMKMNPGHQVAVLLTTTLYSGGHSASTSAAAADRNYSGGGGVGGGDSAAAAPIRVTRIKLLRPSDTLVLGHVYRLVTNQEVMRAKKQAKRHQHQQIYGNMDGKQSSDFETVVTTEVKKNNQINQERMRPSNNNAPTKLPASKSRAWQPALRSISESTS